MLRRGYIHTGPVSLYAHLYMPEAKAKEGAVLCEPYGEERRCASRMMTRLAEKLSRQDVAVIRYDVRGTGDSGGVHAESTWNEWVEDTIAAANELMEAASLTSVTLVGFRSGALLAASAARRLPTECLTLVEPFVSGIEFLQNLERRYSIQRTMGVDGSDSDFGGYPMGDEMKRQLRECTLDALCADETFPLHLLHVTGAKNFPPAWKNLVDRAGRKGSSEIYRDKPFWGQVDYFESDLVINWICAYMNCNCSPDVIY